MNHKRTLIIYRDVLLGSSETFIRAQAESLNRFVPYYLGLRRTAGLDLPGDRVQVVSGGGLFGKAQRARFKLLGPSGSFVRKIAAMRPSLIHAHFGPDACNALPLADNLGVPLVATFHGYDSTVADDRHTSSYIRQRNRLRNHGALFICVSEFIRTKLLAMNFPPERVLVHYTGIDTEFFRPKLDVTRSPLVLFVGRLVAKKGCRYLIRAMAQVQKVVPECKLVVIGDGPLRHELELEARTRLRSCVFLGVQEPSTVKEWMNRSQVFCTPSIVAESGDAEGFGMVFAEAQAMGLPVVSFATGGIPEAVSHGETGLLVPERDEPVLARSLVALLRNEQLRNQFGEAGRARVEKMFNLRMQASRLEDIYAQVLSKYETHCEQN